MYSADEFCEGGIWNTSLFLAYSRPEFTPCFLSIIPIWVPCLYVWLILPFFIKNVRNYSGNIRTTGDTIGHFTVTNCKLVCLGLQAIVTAIETIRLLVTSSSFVNVLSGFLLLTTYILLCFLQWYEKRKELRTSHFVFFYFFVLILVLGSTRIYTWASIWDIQDGVFQFTDVIIFYSLTLVSLILTFTNDNTSPSSEYRQTSDRPDCPEITSPYPSRLFFTWMRSLMVSGFRRDLNYEDVWKINPRDTSSELSPVFERLWEEEVVRVRGINKKRGQPSDDITKELSMRSVRYSNNMEEKTPLLDTKLSPQNEKINTPKGDQKKVKPNLFVVMTKLMWKKVFIGLVQKTIGDFCVFLGPIILGGLIDFLKNYDESKIWQAYTLSILLLVTGLMKSILFARSMYIGSLIGLHTKTVLTNAIYNKALTISGSAKKNTTVGEIVNLMSVDCQRLQEMMAAFLFTWSTPFQLIFAIVLLYHTLGVSIFVGVLLMALTIPINYVLSEKQRICQTEILGLKDNRIKLVNEIINGMKVLKLYAWEMEFKKKVEVIRQLEIRELFKVANIFIILNTVAGLLPFMVGFVTFLTYILIDPNHVLDANKAFVSLALFNLLRVPMIYIAVAIVYTIQTNVCFKRINHFLISEDLDVSTVSHDNTNTHAVEIKSGTFSWDKNGRTILNNINIQVPEGSLVAVIGPIGSGKSSLISAILGEIHKLSGHINVKGSVGYVSQQAWIQNATVRDNILFGGEYDRRRYNTTVKSCQLMSDFEILDGGDKTEIGEKGINISGGQKQRINLARAAYSESEVFLLDDPLSAVDAHVGKAIFDDLIGPKGLLAGKTRILVTHGLQWLPKVDRIIVLSDGHVTDQGSYTELMENSVHFSEFINLYSTEGSGRSDSILRDSMGELDQVNQHMNLQAQIEQEYFKRDRKLSEPMKFQDSFDFELSIALTNSVKSIHPETSKLTQSEVLEKGKIGLDVYKTYIQAAGVIAIPLAFGFFMIFNACLIMSNFWLSEWTEEPILLNVTTKNSDEGVAKSNFYLLIYGLFGVGQTVTHLLYCILYWHAMVRSGKHLHGLLLERLFQAPMSFFDQTPVGRILNRFSRDVDIVDNNLPLVIKDFTIQFFAVLGTIIVILIKTPIFGAVLIPIMVFFFLAQSFYVKTSRQLKRMESIARSPVYTHFSETVTGASVIRAFGATQRFINESKIRIDENQVYYFASQAAIRWLQLNLDVLSNLIVLFAALFQVLGDGRGSDAGLSVSYALQITGIMTFMVRQVCEFETNIVCVERMKEYSQIEQEADLIIPSNRPDHEWPPSGRVEFSEFQLRYRAGLQLVLKGVNCSIKPTEKVGIVGRTGAGKSSLTLGLFRIIEAAGGRIQIDGVNIAEIGLHDLRKRLTILPQDPVLFSGSLRMNIDPFNEYSDDQLWLALEQSHLKDFVFARREGLLYECGEEGSNLSVGQRQLVCLARALLRKTRILVLDEATAAVDLETDSLIQSTIRKAFRDCTILAIAHRLQTVMDYDKIIVMDVGVVKEFDSPDRLIRQQGVFYSMCKDAGLA